MSDSSHPTGTTPDALKRCPFCGEAPEWCNEPLKQSDDGAWCWIQCSCGVRAPEYSIEQDAIDAWNRRAVLPPGASTTEAGDTEELLREFELSCIAANALGIDRDNTTSLHPVALHSRNLRNDLRARLLAARSLSSEGATPYTGGPFSIVSRRDPETREMRSEIRAAHPVQSEGEA